VEFKKKNNFRPKPAKTMQTQRFQLNGRKNEYESVSALFFGFFIMIDNPVVKNGGVKSTTSARAFVIGSAANAKSASYEVKSSPRDKNLCFILRSL
jgi:hypothetical protein